MKVKLRSLRALRTLMPVASASAQSPTVKTPEGTWVYRRLQVRDFHNLTASEFQAWVWQKIKSEYYRANSYNIQTINSIFVSLYGKTMKFNQAPSDILLRMKEVKARTGLSVLEVGARIRRYVKASSLFRKVGATFVPISSERLLRAWALVEQRARPYLVKQTLFH